MMFKLTRIWLLLGCLMTGCQDNTPKSISDRYTHAMEIYHGKNAGAAEAELTAFLTFLSDKQRKSPAAADYNDLRGIVWLRLYSVYRFTCDEAKATDALSHATKLLQGRIVKAQDQQNAEKQLKDLLSGLEGEVTPGWKSSQ
ncbi:MAG: hypothetical protein HS122_06390 [Opitutaceae bacterium]|nr:hypothetical protein [Opitutaceae bacterium]